MPPSANEAGSEQLLYYKRLSRHLSDTSFDFVSRSCTPISFPVLLWWLWTQRQVWQPTVTTEAQLLRHGPLCNPGVCANSLCISDVLHCPGHGRCVVQINWHSVLVLFVYRVQHGRKFHWLPDFVHPTPDRYTVVPEFLPPSQLGCTIVGATVTSMRCTAHSHLSSNSQHSLRLWHPYSWV